jgi:phytoene dehydrogenase-like protein
MKLGHYGVVTALAAGGLDEVHESCLISEKHALHSGTQEKRWTLITQYLSAAALTHSQGQRFWQRRVGVYACEAANINLVGGDPYSGSCSTNQFFLLRLSGLASHRTPIAHLYHIGASTHPGAGLHGTSGLLVAKQLLRRRFSRL